MGNKEIIESINELLAEELTAISQYTLHAEICDNWGYGELHEDFMKTAKVEMKHLAKLVTRVLELDGDVELKLKKIEVGKNINQMIDLSVASEEKAIKDYNEAIVLSADSHDNMSSHILKENEEEEEGHLNYWKAQKVQIKQMGLESYLSTKIG